MSATSHLDHLRQKHQALKLKIQEEQRHPSADDLELTALKREKLHLKEEIERLSRTTH